MTRWMPPWPRQWWQVLFWLQVVAVTALMLMPKPPPSLDTGWDKLNHVLAFAGPGLAGLLALRKPGRIGTAALLLALLAWGAALEVAQSLLPPRTGDPKDLAADAVGLIAGLMLYRLWAGRLRTTAGPAAAASTRR